MVNRAEKPVSPNALVRVSSCLDFPRAYLAQMALAREQIPCSLGNANFLSWFWQDSNAVGGVTIHVRRGEAEQARRVLVAARAKITDILPPRMCSSCGQRVAGQWDACWQCGHWVDGTPSGPLAEDMAAPPSDNFEAVPWWNVSRFVGVAASVVLVIVLLKHGPMLPLLLAPFVLFVMFLLWQFEPSSGRQSEPQGAAEPGDLASRNRPATRSAVSRAIIRRAWQAAVLAAFSFPPLGFYSMRLLWKLGRRDTPLGRADTWRFWTALFFDIATILFCLAFVASLLSALLSALV